LLPTQFLRRPSHCDVSVIFWDHLAPEHLLGRLEISLDVVAKLTLTGLKDCVSKYLPERSRNVRIDWTRPFAE
jgi:hypothetical protein